MAFPTAAGYGNLPNGNFSPVIYSQKAQLAFRKKTTVGQITNSEYMGEIAKFGDTVKIIKEPEISVQAYARGTNIEAQDLDDEDFTMVVDQANYFAFKTDDIEEAHAHHNWSAMASDRAGYRLADNHDQEILAYMSGYKQTAKHQRGTTLNTAPTGTKAVSTAGANELLSSMQLKKGDFNTITTASAGDHSIPLSPRLPGITALPTALISPVTLITRMKKKLDQQFVPSDGRYLVIDPTFCELLGDEDSRFLNADFGESGALRSGDTPVRIQGFRIYMSNNLPEVGTGPETAGTANQNANYGVILGGHEGAVATAEQIRKTESYRDQHSFGDIVRGMHLYGRKILRPEAIVTAKYNVA